MRATSRFDADKVVRVTTLTEERRLEMHFSDARGKTQAVSLPIAAAVDLGCLICDTSDAAPYLVGGIRRATSEEKA